MSHRKGIPVDVTIALVNLRDPNFGTLVCDHIDNWWEAVCSVIPGVVFEPLPRDWWTIFITETEARVYVGDPDVIRAMKDIDFQALKDGRDDPL